MEASHDDTLKAAVESFVAAKDRWPGSMDELDLNGTRDQAG